MAGESTPSRYRAVMIDGDGGLIAFWVSAAALAPLLDHPSYGGGFVTAQNGTVLNLAHVKYFEPVAS